MAGTSTFRIDGGIDKSVLLAVAGLDNDLQGVVTIDTVNGGTLQDVGLRNVNAGAAVPILPATLRNLDLQFTTAPVQVPTIALSGTLNVLAGGEITQAAGGVKVTGASTFNAGGNAITLADPANDFKGAVSASNSGINNAIELTDANAIKLGTVTTQDNLTVTAVGITQDGGGLTVSGTSTFNGGAGAIKLDTASNDFKDAVSSSNSGINNAIELTDANAIKLGAVTTQNNLTVAAVGITQDGTGLRVSSTSMFSGGAGTIKLDSASNDFVGAVSASNSGVNAIQLRDANAIHLGGVTTQNNLTVTAVGITQDGGGLTISGTSTFNGGAGVITLSTASNDFKDAVSANNSGVNEIQLSDTNAIELGTVTTQNNLAVTAAGITQDGTGLTVSGTSTFIGGAGAIKLDTASNDFKDTISASNSGANAIQLRDSNAIKLGTVTTQNNLAVTAVGITQDGTGLTVNGTSTFSGGAGVITLSTPSNDFKDAVSASNSGANAIQLRDANAIKLDTITTDGSLTITAAGDITQTGTLTEPGPSLFTIDTGKDKSVSLAVPGLDNNLQGGVTINAINGGTLLDVGLRNIAGNADTLSPLPQRPYATLPCSSPRRRSRYPLPQLPVT